MTAEHIDIHCPACLESGHGPQVLVVRTNRQNRSEFLGCPRFPACIYSEPLPAWVEMERAGATRLPGW